MAGSKNRRGGGGGGVGGKDGSKEGGKKPFHKKGGNGGKGGGGDRPHRHKKVEITFDPNARKDYLSGFSTRKKERRAFGLAMQKVKDRKAKLEERKDAREAELEQVKEIEQQRRGAKLVEDGNELEADEEDGDNDDAAGKTVEQDVRTYVDEQTTRQFGGLVSVTTTYGIPDDDEDDSDAEFVERHRHGAGHVDTQQRRAGDVNKYIEEVLGKMPAKKSKNGGASAAKKGQHGAAKMKGMGNATSLNTAKKTLSKFQAKGGGSESEGRGKGKGKKGKKGRR